MKYQILLLLTICSLQASNSYQYDGVGRLIQATYDNGTSISYTYDAAGNRLTQTGGSNAPGIFSFTSGNNADFVSGQSGSYTLTVAGASSATYSATGLPAWARLNRSNGVISGTPTNPGVYGFTISAVSGSSTLTQNFLLSVSNALLGQTIAPFGYLVPQVYWNGTQVTITNPTSSSRLPVTLSVLSGPAVLSGPVTNGTTVVTLTGAGIVTLAADQSGNSQYRPAPEVTATIAVGLGSVSNIFANFPQMVFIPQLKPIQLPTPSPTEPPLNIALSGPGVVSSNQLVVNGAGTLVLSISQGAGSNLIASSITKTMVALNFVNLIPLTGPATGAWRDINPVAMDKGTIVGTYSDTIGRHSFVLVASNGIFSTLTGPNDVQWRSLQVKAVCGNSVLGSYSDTNWNSFPFLYDTGSGSYTSLAGPNGARVSSLSLTAASGSAVLGSYSDTNGTSFPFLYDTGSGSYTTISGPLGSNWSKTSAGAISGNWVEGTYKDTNNNSQIFLYSITNASYRTLSGPSVAAWNYINANLFADSLLIGTCRDSNGIRHGFIYDPNADSYVTLDGPKASNWTYVNPVNVSGAWVMGTFNDTNSNPNTFLYNRTNDIYKFVNGPNGLGWTNVSPLNISRSALYGTFQDTNSQYRMFSYNLKIAQYSVFGSDDQVGLKHNYNINLLGVSGGYIGGNYMDSNGNWNPFFNSLNATPVPVLGAFTIPSKPLGANPFNITTPSSPSSGKFIFTSSNTNVAIISGNTLTVTGAGTATITASQFPTFNYTSSAISTQFIVTPR
jgi:YD repeat-containing protein